MRPPRATHRLRRRLVRPVPLAVAAALVAGTGALVPLLANGAESTCRVDYSVTGQWADGFQGAVEITNSGKALTGWELTFDLSGGEKVNQGWNGSWSQSGTTVTVKNASWNGSLATGGKASTGFLGSRSGATSTPTSFKLNGETCSSGVDATPSSGATVAPTFSESSSPTATPTATQTATSTPSATATPTPKATATPTPTETGTTSAAEWNPPSGIASQLDQTFAHMVSTYSDLYGFKNYGFDQIMATKGTINYCVRWDSDNPVTATLRDKVESTVQKQFGKWITALSENGKGYNQWPYPSVKVKVVGWAVKDRATLKWTDDSVDIYAGNLDEGGAPQCSPPCGRFFHQDGNYSQCPGKEARHYDQSLWLTKGMGFGGAGGDWGQRLDQEYFTSAMDQENVHIYLHEVGHTFGLADFYDWTPTPDVGGFIMNAGSATQITEFDKWMVRDFWRHIKNRYGY
ncbi:cellulose-binding domain-containing protein [Streptomyces sp. NPDC002588]|uniref:cellulose-binding domain-containing protein n=1 Tax=Streptomyces sp. NPDC002588 TaxID=3154419 RepID=UPI0033264FAE